MTSKREPSMHADRLQRLVKKAVSRADPAGRFKRVARDDYEAAIGALSTRLKRLRVKPTADRVTIMAQEIFEQLTSEESKLRRVVDYGFIATLILEGWESSESL